MCASALIGSTSTTNRSIINTQQYNINVVAIRREKKNTSIWYSWFWLISDAIVVVNFGFWTKKFEWKISNRRLYVLCVIWLFISIYSFCSSELAKTANVLHERGDWWTFLFLLVYLAANLVEQLCENILLTSTTHSSQYSVLK